MFVCTSGVTCVPDGWMGPWGVHGRVERLTRWTRAFVCRELRGAVDSALAGDSADSEVAPLASTFDLLNLVAPAAHEQGMYMWALFRPLWLWAPHEKWWDTNATPRNFVLMRRSFRAIVRVEPFFSYLLCQNKRNSSLAEHLVDGSIAWINGAQLRIVYVLGSKESWILWLNICSLSLVGAVSFYSPDFHYAN